ncbi:expressed unknown protein [Seminavis robusta]|uniref:G-protein coupled receptors family 2 profile 2 domain-containing protein n=1 Tax=Seminavis robusta TaxID=568900 RepID=A0A9N8DHP0_9STRA|nr:expressed unknown protein [Seminavis robusta]|eukprot:Sro158_g071460.1 n/a (796) ;mRNA; f:15219-17715
MTAFTEYYLPKIAALFSMLGSGLIIAEVLQDGRQRGARSTTFKAVGAVSRVLLSMSVGDILFSFGWFLGSWANFGSKGFCVFQGFILHLGYMASLLFSASLAVVYLLMIQYNWRQRRILPRIPIIAIIMWGACLVLAVLPIPLDMYQPTGTNCWIGSSESQDATFIVASLQVIPVWSCILLDASIMFFLFRKARLLEAEVEHVALRSSNSTNATKVLSTTSRANDPRSEGADDTDDNPERMEQAQAEESVQLEEQHPETDIAAEPPREEIEESDHSNQDGEPSTRIYSTSTQYSTTSNSPRSKKRSQIVAKQGIGYIAGFLMTYGFATISVLVFLISGEWNPPLDRTSYFFLASQGVFNFLVFSHGRRQMKTRVGAKLKSWIWNGAAYCHACCCRCLPLSDELQQSSRDGTSATVRQHNNMINRGAGNSNERQQQYNDEQRQQQEHKFSPMMLAPIDEELGQLQSGSNDSISFCIRGAKKERITSQFVSELGASEMSRSSYEDAFGDEGGNCLVDSPPSKPLRAQSQAEFSPSRVPPCKPERMASGHQLSFFATDISELDEASIEESPPTKPMRLVSEVSQISVDKESVLEICTRNDPSSPPSKPIRLVSELENTADIPPSITPQLAPPTRPIRVLSEVSALEDEQYNNPPIQSFPPTKPLRLASEVSELSTLEDYNDVAPIPISPPTKPVRFASEVSELSTLEEDHFIVPPIESAPPTKPVRLVSDVSDVSTGCKEAKSAAVAPPSKPTRFASEISAGKEDYQDDHPNAAYGESYKSAPPAEPIRYGSDVEVER